MTIKEERPTLTHTEVKAATSRARIDKLLKVLGPPEGFTTRNSESVFKTSALSSKTETTLYKLMQQIDFEEISLIRKYPKIEKAV